MSQSATIQALLQQARAVLTESDSASLDAELLLAHLLKKGRTWLHTWPEQTVTPTQLAEYQKLIGRRQQGEPIAHLTGEQSFWTLDLKVTSDTLVPRPETELLVETALSRMTDQVPWRVADLGTGSGAIALAIASEQPQAHLYATDQSAAALAIAAENASKLKINTITFLQGGWLEPLPAEPFDLILSNPPYIADQDPHLTQGDLRFEPASALSSGVDGLDDLRTIIEAAIDHLKPDGWLMVEHGYDQGNAVRSLFQQHHYHSIETRHDLAQLERITFGARP